MDGLGEFLREAARKDYRLGEWDCGLWLADWYVAHTGRADPAAHIRGREYSDAELARQMRAILKLLGLPRTKNPKRGDVGMVSLCRGHLAGAIFTGRWWCVLTNERGIGAAVPHRFRFIAAWHII